jgi:hypothetical protein
LLLTWLSMFSSLTLPSKLYARTIVNNFLAFILGLHYYFNWGFCVDKCRKGCCKWEKEDPKALSEALRSTWWYDNRDIWPAAEQNSWKNYWTRCSWHASQREGKLNKILTFFFPRHFLSRHVKKDDWCMVITENLI